MFIFPNRTVLSECDVNLLDQNMNQYYHLWSSVCSTLSACVNNPQNGNDLLGDNKGEGRSDSFFSKTDLSFSPYCFLFYRGESENL